MKTLIRTLHKCMRIVMVCALAAPVLAVAAPKALTPEAVHARIVRLGVGNWTGVRLQTGVAFSGRIVSLDAHGFTLMQYGHEEATPVGYGDVFSIENLRMVRPSGQPLTAEAVHARLLKRGLGKPVAVQLENGIAFWGNLVSIDDNSFGMQLYGDPETTPVAYSDVVYLWSGMTGGQKAFFIGLPVAFTAASIGGMVAMHNNQPTMPTLPTLPTNPANPVFP